MDESGNICRTNGGNHTEEQLVSCLVLTFTTMYNVVVWLHKSVVPLNKKRENTVKRKERK